MVFPQTAVDIPLRTDEGGVIRVGQTRVTLQSVMADFHEGASPEAIVHHYPALNLADVYLIVGYYLQNPDAVDAYVHEQRELAEEARRDYEASAAQDPLRAKLLAQVKRTK